MFQCPLDICVRKCCILFPLCKCACHPLLCRVCVRIIIQPQLTWALGRQRLCHYACKHSYPAGLPSFFPFSFPRHPERGHDSHGYGPHHLHGRSRSEPGSSGHAWQQHEGQDAGCDTPEPGYHCGSACPVWLPVWHWRCASRAAVGPACHKPTAQLCLQSSRAADRSVPSPHKPNGTDGQLWRSCTGKAKGNNHVCAVAAWKLHGVHMKYHCLLAI